MVSVASTHSSMQTYLPEVSDESQVLHSAQLQTCLLQILLGHPLQTQDDLIPCRVAFASSSSKGSLKVAWEMSEATEQTDGSEGKPRHSSCPRKG